MPVNECINKIAAQTGVDRNALERLIYNESRGNINAGWDQGHYTQGVAQVSETVWRQYSTIPWQQAGNPKNYQENIMVAALYLKRNYQRFGSWKLAMESYNVGPTALAQILTGQRQLPSITANYIQGIVN